MKFIFLDVDGVLNCATTEERVRDLLFVEDRKVQLLKELVDETGATIILSSTWRFGFENPNLYPELLELENKLAQFGLFIKGSTPVDARGHRGKEIDEWLKAHADEVESFVILDDDGDTEPWVSHLVKTSWAKGLQPNHIREAKRILNERMEIT